MSLVFVPRAARSTSAALLTAFLAACGGGGDGGTTNPPPAPGDFGLTLSSTTLSVVQGGTSTLTASVARTGSFTGTVDVSAEGLPTGVSASFNPATVGAGVTSTVLTVTAAASVAPGNYTFTIRGRATGLADKTGQATLTVTAAPAIAVALTPTAGSVVQGQSTTIATTITRTNFTGAVTLGVSGAPTGVTTTVAQNGDAGTITVNVGATATPGTSTLTVTATGTGVPAATATYALTITAAPAGAIALTLSAANATVTVGNTTTFTVNIARTNYAGNVAVALTGVPTGVTPTITTTPTAGNSVQVQLAVGAGTAPGTYGITVTGSGTGIPNATAQFTLTVNAAPAIALALTPTNATVQQGNSTTLTVAIARTNFAGNVTLAVSGAPAGVNVSYSTNPVAVDGATITLAVGSGVTPGVYQLTVTGSGTGIANATATFTLTVQQATAGTGNVTWTFGFCGAQDIPIWVAAQNGSGAWQRVVGVNNSYSFTITSQGGIAYVTQNGANDFDISFYFGSLAEMQARGSSICPTAALKTVNGSVANYGTSTFAQISLGPAFQQVQNPMTTFQLQGVPPGTVDLVAVRSGIDLANPLAGLQVNKLIIRRGLNPADGSTLPVLDFNGAEAFDPDRKTLTIGGGTAGEQLLGGVTYFTANQGFAVLSSGTLASGGVVNYPAVPSSRQAATDLHIVTAIGTVASGGTSTSSRVLTEVFKDAGNRTVTLPPALNTPTFTTLATAPYLRNRVQLARQPEYGNAWVLGYGQNGRAVSVFISSGYLGSDPFDFAFPDFSTVAGWQNTWGLAGGALTTYNISASGWTLGGSGFVNPYLEGTVIRTGARTGQFTP